MESEIRTVTIDTGLSTEEFTKKQLRDDVNQLLEEHGTRVGAVGESEDGTYTVSLKVTKTVLGQVMLVLQTEFSGGATSVNEEEIKELCEELWDSAG